MHLSCRSCQDYWESNITDMLKLLLQHQQIIMHSQMIIQRKKKRWRTWLFQAKFCFQHKVETKRKWPNILCFNSPCNSPSDFYFILNYTSIYYFTALQEKKVATVPATASYYSRKCIQQLLAKLTVIITPSTDLLKGIHDLLQEKKVATVQATGSYYSRMCLYISALGVAGVHHTTRVCETHGHLSFQR